jgi:AcrR family transcriptional regulator
MVSKVRKRPRIPASQRRAMLLVAAREEFIETGYSGARIKCIAARAGVAETIIYRFFKSKEELFERAVLEPIELLMARPRHISQVVNAKTDGERIAAIRDACHGLLKTMVEVAPLLGVALFAHQNNQRFYQERMLPLLERWSESTRKAMLGWEHQDIAAGVLTTMNFGMGLSFAMDAALRDVPLDLDATASTMAEFIYWGIKGHRPMPT